MLNLIVRHRTLTLGLFILLLAGAIACGSDKSERTLYFSGIPDQDVSILQDRFDALAEYLTEAVGVEVKYAPSVDYSAVVTAFARGDIHLAWYGGLTGVQARLAIPDSLSIAQRPEDEEFHSVFLVRKGLDVDSLADLKGSSFTFGSESSTSGHLMPRHFLVQAGIDPEKDFSAVNYSGSHDVTWKLVESGAFDAGALNAVVWQQRVRDGEVDTSKVDVFYTTPSYVDYHWVIRGDADQVFGKGVIKGIREALLDLDSTKGGAQELIMKAFQADRFVPTANENYQAIEDVARQLELIKD